jgi:peptide/nickel transport system ATP-binding protein
MADTRSGAGAMLLEAVALEMTYPRGWRRRAGKPVLKGVNLSLGTGEVVGVVGESGSGKTTLGMLLAGILKPDRGAVRYAGTDLWACGCRRRRHLARNLQMVFQHPETTFDPCWSLARSLGEAFVLRGKSFTVNDLAARLEQVDLSPCLLNRRPHQLSGGELQRAAIARAMALDPTVLVLDEPTAMLDALTQAEIFALLKRIQDRSAVTYLLISHDPDLVARFCHRAFCLTGGRLAPA